ncbi:hypothetical protein PZA11_002444 [Diplocarpon coronariae]
MQSYAFLTLATVFALAIRAQETFYGVSFGGVCDSGENIYCKAQDEVCPKGFVKSFDTKSTTANEKSCGDGSFNEDCLVTVLCTGKLL